MGSQKSNVAGELLPSEGPKSPGDIGVFKTIDKDLSDALIPGMTKEIKNQKKKQLAFGLLGQLKEQFKTPRLHKKDEIKEQQSQINQPIEPINTIRSTVAPRKTHTINRNTIRQVKSFIDGTQYGVKIQVQQLKYQHTKKAIIRKTTLRKVKIQSKETKTTLEWALSFQKGVGGFNHAAGPIDITPVKDSFVQAIGSAILNKQSNTYELSRPSLQKMWQLICPVFLSQLQQSIGSLRVETFFREMGEEKPTPNIVALQSRMRAYLIKKWGQNYGTNLRMAMQAQDGDDDYCQILRFFNERQEWMASVRIQLTGDSWEAIIVSHQSYVKQSLKKLIEEHVGRMKEFYKQKYVDDIQRLLQQSAAK